VPWASRDRRQGQGQEQVQEQGLGQEQGQVQEAGTGSVFLGGCQELLDSDL